MTQSIAEPGTLSRFDEDGYVILRGILPAEVVEGVRDELKLIVDEHAKKLVGLGKIQDEMKAEPFEKRLAKLYAGCMELSPLSLRGDLLHRPGFYGMFFYPKLLDLVEQILGPELRLYPNYTVRSKFPDDVKTVVLWHQDAAYTENQEVGALSNLRMVNVWSPLVPATVENGCMQFVPGTHKLGVVRHVEKEYYKEIAPEELERHVRRAVDIELDPGDVVLFSNLLFHVGRPNLSDHVRWSVDWRYQDLTQPTLRPSNGQVARSRKNRANEVKDGKQWAGLKAGFK